MLREKEIRRLRQEHMDYLESNALTEGAREFYKTRLELLDLILGSQAPAREPPTNNETLRKWGR